MNVKKLPEMPVSPPVTPPAPQRKPARRTCGNCAMSSDAPDGSVVCRMSHRWGFNARVDGIRYPADRGGCIHHRYGEGMP